MSVTINSYVPIEVGKVNPASMTTGLVEGVLLMKSRSAAYAYALATDEAEAVMLSEVVTELEATKRQFLFKDIDFSGWTRIGEPSSIAKKLKGATCLGLAFTPQGGITAAGSQLQVVAGFLAPKAAGKVIAIALDAIAAGSTVTGRVLVTANPV